MRRVHAQGGMHVLLFLLFNDENVNTTYLVYQCHMFNEDCTHWSYTTISKHGSSYYTITLVKLGSKYVVFAYEELNNKNFGIFQVSKS